MTARIVLFSLLSMAITTPAARSADSVIFLHGLMRSSRSMQKLERAFSERGYTVVNIDYPSRQKPIEELADSVVAEALTACARNNPGEIHFVTHSLGGIVLRYYLAHHTVPNLGRVVMLAPPNQGSEVVDRLRRVPGFGLCGGPAGRELGTDPASIPLRLGPVDYPVGVIAGTRSVNPLLSLLVPDRDDGKVAVNRTKVQGMADFITLPVSHPFMMRRGVVIEQALAFVDSGAFVHAVR